MFQLNHNVSLAKFTTYRIGGKAKYYFVARNLQELADALQWCKSNQVPWFLLGFGSNILVSDEGFPGLVLKLGGDFSRITFDDINRTITVGAAAMLPIFARECAKRSISGFECLCDIPGSMGAAVRINAGTKEGEVKDQFVLAKIMDEEGQKQTIKAVEMNFGYRTSGLMQNRCIVLESRFNYGAEREPEQINATMRSIRDARKTRRPANPKNCGSVFKSVEGRAAGWYIEQCGLKGKRIGNAMIANEHANWIVNMGEASAADIKALISLSQNAVKDRFGIVLDREVEFVPEDISGVSTNDI